MIAYIKGKVLKKLPKAIIVDTTNIGYLVHLSTPLLEKISVKDSVEFYIHTKVREDDISLFGFEKFEDLEFFQLLLSVNGIGPKIGLEIMASSTDKTKAAILSNDLAYLSKIQGIGKKTAERMVVELKSKVTWEDAMRSHSSVADSLDDEVTEALSNLGYQKFEISKILDKMPKTVKTSEEAITYFLKNI